MMLSCIPDLLSLQNVTQRFLISIGEDLLQMLPSQQRRGIWMGLRLKTKSASIARIAVAIDSTMVQVVLILI